jgi:hypothetical protein
MLVGGLIASTGCDSPPSVPRNAEGKLVTALPAADPQETQLAQNLVDARDLYHFRVLVIREYYNKIGDMLKLRWADNELANLAQAHTFTYQGLTPAPVPPSPDLDQTDELSLAEPVGTSRRDYLAAVTALRDYYAGSGNEFKAAMLQNILDRFDPIRTYKYFLQAEVPTGSPRPVEVSAEAEAMYNKALKLHKAGKILPLVVDYQKEREALLLFLSMVETYPNSPRVAMAAYYIADIYKEYFDENYRAALWYERAWQWDPGISKPARFQAATIYDIRLNHRGKALELYKLVLQY